MKLFFALLSLFLLLHISSMAMQENNPNSDYIIHVNAVTHEDMFWAYQTLYPDDWQKVLDDHFSINFNTVYDELSAFKENILKALDLSADLKEIGIQACDIILLIFPK